MYYGYDICPKCKDKLIEREYSCEKEEDFEEYSEQVCTKCGRRLVLACTGNKKMDNDITIYKIILKEEAFIKEEKLFDTLRKINPTIVKEDIYINDFVIFEGKAHSAYNNIEMLSNHGIAYIVIPEYPYKRFVYPEFCMCFNCGGETVKKTQEIDVPKNSIRQGLYCESCKNWVLFHDYMKWELDKTIYKLSFFLVELNCANECTAKEELQNEIAQLSNKKIRNGKMIIWDSAKMLHYIMQKLNAIHVVYDIFPSYPHEIEEYQEDNEEFINEILEMNRRLYW